MSDHRFILLTETYADRPAFRASCACGWTTAHRSAFPSHAQANFDTHNQTKKEQDHE